MVVGNGDGGRFDLTLDEMWRVLVVPETVADTPYHGECGCGVWESPQEEEGMRARVCVCVCVHTCVVCQETEDDQYHGIGRVGGGGGGVCKGYRV